MQCLNAACHAGPVSRAAVQLACSTISLQQPALCMLVGHPEELPTVLSANTFEANSHHRLGKQHPPTCTPCYRRCKSFEDLQKHFRQLHEREHQKKMRGPKKFAAKYSKSDKAARVR